MHAHAIFSHLEDNIWFESISQTCGEINGGFFIIIISRDSLSAQSPDPGAHGKMHGYIQLRYLPFTASLYMSTRLLALVFYERLILGVTIRS